MVTIILLNQENYEKYMESVTDAFAALCTIDRTASVMIVAGDKVSIAAYKYSAHIVGKREDLEWKYRGENHKDMLIEFYKQRQMVAQEFLDIYKRSYPEWMAWQSTINDIKLKIPK